MWYFLFDLDGTVLDTTDLIVASFLYTFETGLGQAVTREQLMVHFGRPLVEQFRLMRPDLLDHQIDRLVRLYLEHNEAEHDGLVQLVPGADIGLRTLAATGNPLGIVTSKRRDLTRRGLRLFGLDELFSVIVALESTRRHKPHPEPVEYAIKRLKADPKRTIYVGDSPYDMMAGHAAGVRTLGLVHNTFSRADLSQAGADDVVDTWSDIVAVLSRWSRSEDTKDSYFMRGDT